MTEYQPRTPERLADILEAHDRNPRSWQREAAFFLREYPAGLKAANEKIATLSRQLAEAQEARDLNAAALECYSAEQARLRKELAEARAVADRLVAENNALWWAWWELSGPTQEAIYGEASPAFQRVLKTFRPHTAALQTGEKP